MISSTNRILKAIATHIANTVPIDRSYVRITISPPLYFDWFPVAVSIVPKSITYKRYFGSEVTAGGNMAAGQVMPFAEVHFSCIVSTIGALDVTGTSEIDIDDNATNPGHFYYLQRVLTALNGLYVRDSSTQEMITHGAIAIVSIDPIGRLILQEPERRPDFQLHRGMVESSINCYFNYLQDIWPGDIVHIVDV